MLETTFIIIIVVLLLGAIINIWLWANTQLVKRQLKYNDTRVAAGTSSDFYKLDDPGEGHPWPVYNSEELGEDKVLLGAPPITN